jgi:hypothetical protein
MELSGQPQAAPMEAQGGVKRSAEDAFAGAGCALASPRLRSACLFQNALGHHPTHLGLTRDLPLTTGLPPHRRRADDTAKQARVDEGGQALAAAAASAEAAAGATEAPTASAETAAAPAEAAAAAAAAASGTAEPQPVEQAPASELPQHQQQQQPAAAEAAPSSTDTAAAEATVEKVDALTTTQPVEEPAADAAGPSGVSGETAGAPGLSAAVTQQPPAEQAAATTAPAQPDSAVAPAASTAAAPAASTAAAASVEAAAPAASAASLPPLEKPAARAMLAEVDTLLKTELAFLREMETKFGTRGAANGEKPAGARKRRSESRSAALIEPLSMDLGGGGGAMDSQFRSPRTPKPNSRWTQPTATRGVSAALRPFVQVLDRMMKHRDAAGFNMPVNQLWSMELLPGYYDVVKRPMDLGTIKTRLNEGHYGENPEAFAADVRLVWKNCMSYNNPDTEFHHTADRMRLLFEQAYKASSEKSAAVLEKDRLKQQQSQAAAQPKKSRPKAEPKPKPSRASKPKEKKKKKKKEKKRSTQSGFDAVQMMNDNLQRVLSQMDGRAAAPREEKVPSRTMELWEKERLVKMMDKLEPDKFGTALSIIKQSHRVNLEEVESDEEVTIDIDTLDSKTLWKLHKYVEDNIPKKRPAKKKMSQAEKQRLDRDRISQREQSLRDELSQLQGNLAAAAAGSDSSSSSSSSDSDSD